MDHLPHEINVFLGLAGWVAVICLASAALVLGLEYALTERPRHGKHRRQP